MAYTSTSSVNSVLIRAVIMAFFLLAGIFIGLLFFEDNLSKIFGNYSDEAIIGGMLLAIWLVVSSTLRSVNNLAKAIPAWKLVLGGTLTGFIGSVLTVAFLLLFPNVAKSQNMTEVTGATGGLILMMTAVAFVISLISIINIRVKNRQLGNLLEILIIGGCIAGFVYFATR
ncbi:MAG: hypothetical protein HY842_13685 [Bacteroidetes bacterium]|nr:hypothetical protein [Bacteroidota bacterium]